MSDEKNDVGHAPKVPDGERYFDMSLRDYFAVQALNGLLAANVGEDQWNTYEAMIERAWDLSDMMLAARKAKP